MGSSGPASRRALFVHAHPDDETIGTGATMAHYAATGVHVAVLTCTLGEFGEVLVSDLAELDADHGDQLGGYRMGELRAALSALGIEDHRYLGAAGRFHDSGMMGTPANAHPRAFWRAATDPAVFAEAVRCAVDVIRDVRPQVVVTYDPDGQYGHPDHIMANRVTTAALDAAADPAFATDAPPWTVAKFYWTALSASTLTLGLAELARAGTPFRSHRAETFPGALADDAITTTIDATDGVGAKAAAMRAHATQISVAEPFYALSNGLGMPLTGVEHFRLVRGELGLPVDRAGRESDLFAGLG